MNHLPSKHEVAIFEDSQKTEVQIICAQKPFRTNQTYQFQFSLILFGQWSVQFGLDKF